MRFYYAVERKRGVPIIRCAFRVVALADRIFPFRLGIFCNRPPSPLEKLATAPPNEPPAPRIAPTVRLLPAFAQVVRETGEKFFEGHVERFANSQQREHGNRTPGLDILPVANAETIEDHIFLAQATFRSVRPNAVAQGAEEASVVGRQVSVGTHTSSVCSSRFKTPRSKNSFCSERGPARSGLPDSRAALGAPFWSRKSHQNWYLCGGKKEIRILRY